MTANESLLSLLSSHVITGHTDVVAELFTQLIHVIESLPLTGSESLIEPIIERIASDGKKIRGSDPRH